MIRYIFSATFIIGILTLISVDSKAQNSITMYRIAKIKVHFRFFALLKAP